MCVRERQSGLFKGIWGDGPDSEKASPDCPDIFACKTAPSPGLWTGKTAESGHSGHFRLVLAHKSALPHLAEWPDLLFRSDQVLSGDVKNAAARKIFDTISNRLKQHYIMGRAEGK